MRSKLHLLITILCFISCKTESESDNDIKGNTGSTLNVNQEPFTAVDEVFNGWLTKDITDKQLASKLGTEYNISDQGYSEVDGYYYEKWNYPEQGIILLMQSEEPNGSKTVFEITIKAPSDYKTLKGIGIDSHKDEIYKAYPDANQDDVTSDIIVVGTIYEGLFFTIKNNKVSEIFAGALAE